MGDVPVGFLDGVVITIYKSGPRVQASNYRPITLLNTDYRVLAKVLAYRLRKVQQHVIQPEQTAFLPGRHIGENIMLLQLLPSAIGPNSQAAAVFLDFYKAYDTLSRQFLFSVLEVLGFGGGFLRWVQMLLTSTQACALVNGYVSGFHSYTAGVRQGCPLAPQLYLFVAQALLSFLKQRGFGIRVASGRTLTAGQFADDAQVFLTSVPQVHQFLAAMQVFKAASGQGLNMDKTLVLPMGRAARLWLWQAYYKRQLQQGQCVDADQQLLQQQATQQAVSQMLQSPASVPPETTYDGLRVVDQAKSLGLVFKVDGTVAVDWEAKLDKVLDCFTFISTLPLSTFGRGFATAAYGVSKLLYAAEFAGMPPPAVVQKLDTATAKLVDRQQSPKDTRHRFPGVSGDMLVGHPRDGGFGVLPWHQHILARHAVWAVKLMQGQDEVAWIHVARLLLAPPGSVCPAWATFASAMCVDAAHGPTNRPLPVPLARLVNGFKSLPQWRDVSLGQAVVLGDWCANAPLWCNPLLVRQSSTTLPIRGLEADFMDLAELSTLTTVRHALAALADVSRVRNVQQYMDTVFPFWFKRNALFLDKEHALQRITALVAAIPQAWRDAADAAPANFTAVSGVQVVRTIFDRIGWYDPVHPGQPVKLAGLTVRQATSLQMQPIVTARQVKHDAFLAEAQEQGVQGQYGVMLNMRRCLHALFHQLWRLKWDNARKELFWRMVLDGLPTSARMHMLGASCACGISTPGRLHHYWECPVAQAVVDTINTQLPHDHHVRRINVWLAKVPSGSNMHTGIWMVVCLAALGAMDKGRKTLSRLDLAARPGSTAPARVLPLDVRILIASKVAIATFWDLLQDFVGMGLCPEGWLMVGPDHPFLRVHTAPDASQHLEVVRG